MLDQADVIVLDRGPDRLLVCAPRDLAENEVLAEATDQRGEGWHLEADPENCPGGLARRHWKLER